MIPNQDNVRKAVLLQTATDIVEQCLKRFLPQTNRPRVAHVARRGLNMPLRDELDDWRHQGIAKPTGDGFSSGLEHIVMLSKCHIRTTRLDPARTDNNCGLASLDGIAHLHPGELFQEDAIDRGYRPWGLEILRQAAWDQTPTAEHDEPHSAPTV